MNVPINTPKPPALQGRSVVSDAWAVHSAMLRAEVSEPCLRDNPQWTAAKLDAYETFHEAFVRACEQ
jgi:hypothetical protein